MSLQQILVRMLGSFDEELMDTDAGVRSYLTSCAIETPIELEVARAGNGPVRIGVTPPLYYVDTTFRPSYHRITFLAERG